jgi:RimJ/RimL family protein N-acetyltransferase
VSVGITLQTKRLILRRLTVEDAAPLCSYRSLLEIYRYQNFRPTTIAESRAFIEATAAETNIPDTWYQLGIFLADERVLIGDIGIHFPAGDEGTVELGCTLVPGYQGCGYATEALTAVIGYLFTSQGKDRVIFSIDPRNAPSRRLAERLGMRQASFSEKSILIRGEWCDDLVYEIEKTGQDRTTDRSLVGPW